jgi:hypothetical protein
MHPNGQIPAYELNFGAPPAPAGPTRGRCPTGPAPVGPSPSSTRRGTTGSRPCAQAQADGAVEDVFADPDVVTVAAAGPSHAGWHIIRPLAWQQPIQFHHD